MKISYIGPDEYGSSDPFDGGRSIHLRSGESDTVSAEKAAQLKADFPHWFQFEKPAAKHAAKKTAAKKAAAAPAAPAADADPVGAAGDAAEKPIGPA
jgi:hypothetical protein